MLVHKVHDRMRAAGVRSGGASLRVKSVYKCEIKQRVKSVELLDIACRGIIGRILECRAPPPFEMRLQATTDCLRPSET